MCYVIACQFTINRVFYSRYEAAEADCNRSIKHDPNYVKAYLRRGASRLKLGKLGVAAEDFQRLSIPSIYVNAVRKKELLLGVCSTKV